MFVEPDNPPIAKCEQMTASHDHIIPRDDPLVMQLYSCPSPEPAGVVANRSAIAIGVFHTANALGLKTGAAWAKEDKLALHHFT